MKNAAITCRHLVKYAAPSLSDLTDAHLARASIPGGKTAGWIVGHLCITGDFVRRKADRPPFTAKDWRTKFAPGTSAPPSAAEYPPMADLRDALNRIYTDLADAAESFPAELLSGPNPFEPAQPRFATFGEFAAWIMTGHLGYHLGQLSEWRASAGMPLRPGATSPWM